MNLKELELSKQFRSVNHLDSDSLEAILQKNNWKILGTGIEGSVAEHPNKSYVLKLFKTNSKYKDFVKFVNEHKDNPHLPKFSRDIKQIPGFPEISYIRMNKLNKISHGLLLTTYFSYLCCIYYFANKYDIGGFFPSWGKGIEFKLDEMGYYIDDLTLNDINKKFGKVPATWVDVVHNLAEKTKSLGLKYMDFKPDNFMLDGNKLVIIDPFS